MLQVNWIIDISQSAYSQFRLLTQHFEDNSGFDCGAVEDNHVSIISYIYIYFFIFYAVGMILCD